MKKLVILGNGFDLHCRLKSSFGDFFKNEIKIIEEGKDERGFPTFKNVSLVSLLLYNTFIRSKAYCEDGLFRTKLIDYQQVFQKELGINKKPIHWMDVEEYLSLVVNSKFMKLMEECFNTSFRTMPNYETSCLCWEDGIKPFMAIRSCTKAFLHVENFYDYFFQEIKEFEKSFAKYLRNELKTNKLYKKNVSKMISALCEKDTGVILNFNYTRIGLNNRFKEINVHGSLDKDIIIGIDRNNVLYADSFMFTKTFRKLLENHSDIVLTESYDEIVIYGHSLGKQDYSYFQSIFDYVNLYNSNTKIVLIYSDDFIVETPNGKNKMHHRLNVVKSFFDLLQTYGNTLNNKDNGKNMIHKLILEGRISIVLKNYSKLITLDELV